jgi:signal transduction histidine kinase
LNKNLSFQEKIRSDFLADFSHEIKTPISAIKCYLEGIEDKVFSMDEKTIGLLHKEIDRLIKISTSIMDFEAIDRLENASCEPARNDFTAMLHHIKEEYKPNLTKNKQKIEFKGEKKFFIEVDEQKWMQLLHNIVSNFLKYSGSKTTLTVSYFHDIDWTHILFADDGTGVPVKELPFLKEKFYKVDKSRNSSHERGMGIGLSVVDKIIELHQGILSFDSEV